MKNVLLLSLLFLFSCAAPTFEEAGGVRVVLEAHNADPTQLERIKSIITQRLKSFGIDNPTVRAGEKPEQLIVEIPGKLHDMQRIRKLLQSTAKLEFWETHENKELYEKIAKLNTVLSEELFPELKDTVVEEVKANLEGVSMEKQFAAQKSEKEIEEEKMKNAQKQNPLFALLNPAVRYDGRNYELMDGPVVGMALLKDTSKINSYFNSPTAKKIFGSGVKFLWTLEPIKETKDIIHQLVAIRITRTGKAALYDNIIEDAKVSDSDWGPQISMTMQKVAAMDWHKLTRDNIGRSIAIVVDDQVYSYPFVNSEIPGGVAVISGNFTQQQAQDFASVLKAGSLPVPVKIVSEEVVTGKK